MNDLFLLLLDPVTYSAQFWSTFVTKGNNMSTGEFPCALLCDIIELLHFIGRL